MNKITERIKCFFTELVGYVFVFSFLLALVGAFLSLSVVSGLQKFGHVLALPFVVLMSAVLLPVIAVQVIDLSKWLLAQITKYWKEKGC